MASKGIRLEGGSVRAGEGESGGRNGVGERGKEGTQQGREGSKQEEEAIVYVSQNGSMMAVTNNNDVS